MNLAIKVYFKASLKPILLSFVIDCSGRYRLVACKTVKNFMEKYIYQINT